MAARIAAHIGTGLFAFGLLMWGLGSRGPTPSHPVVCIVGLALMMLTFIASLPDMTD